MRKIFILPMLLLVLMVSFLSCKKESIDVLSPAGTGETISVQLTPSQSYVLNQPDASNLSISRQASHFFVSEAVANIETGGFSYKYIPVAGYTGTDEISLLSSATTTNYSHSSEGVGCGSGSSESKTSSRLITLKISIGN